MKSFLHGDWLGHPLHPALVHLPTSLWPAALLFDVLTWTGLGSDALVQSSFWAIALGLAGALLAVPPGVADWLEVGRDKPAWKFGLYHMLLNIVVVVVWTVNLLLRIRMPSDATSVPPGLLALSAVGTLLLFTSVYLGGRMVFDHGTFVGWHSLKKWRQIAEAGGANVPPEKE